MKLSEIRSELLRGHIALRATLRDATGTAARWLDGEPVRDELHGCLGRLVSEVRAHNAREEELLREIIPTIDAWGPVRADVMVEEHVKEHEELYAALVQASTTAQAEVAVRAIVSLAERLNAHMDHEEKVFLAEDILRDEAGVPTDYFGG
jgi:hypothetical protein